MLNSYLLLIFCFFNFFTLGSNDKPINNDFAGNDYFPIHINKTLIYDSDFGETVLKVKRESDFYVFNFQGDDFTYRQKLLIDKNGVFVKETYQYLKMMLIISKEGKYTYSDPLPRIKFPLQVGNKWNWKGEEYDDGSVYNLDVNSSVEKIEKLKVPAGTFESFKLVTTVSSTKGTKSKVTEWYAKDIGLVKMAVLSEGGGIIGTARDLLGLGEIVFELKSITKNKN